MIKKLMISLLLISLIAPVVLADQAPLSPADQAYINQQTYEHNKLELTTKTRTISEQTSNSNTEISSEHYRYPGYSESNANIDTSTVNREQQLELTEWYIYKGGVQELNDLEFLDLIGDRAMHDQVDAKRDSVRLWQRTGYITIGAGLVAMIGGAALQASEPVIIGGALVTTVGFFISAFSAPPHHFIKSGYALNKIDEYNLKLKQQLNLPVNFQ